MSTLGEILVDVVVVAFIGLLVAGAKHVHNGKCENYHDHATAQQAQSSP